MLSQIKDNPEELKALLQRPRPIPGSSLTANPDAPRPWERPPKFVSVHEASEYILGLVIEEEMYIRVMTEFIDGRTLMEVTQSLLYVGAYQGLWGPDMILLLAEPTAYMLLALAERAGIEPSIYIGEEEEEDTEEALKSGTGDLAVFESLKERAKSLKTIPGNVSVDKEMLDKIEALPTKEEIQAPQQEDPSLVEKPNDSLDMSTEESLIKKPSTPEVM